MRLGFLGGTFDPVHDGHLAMARRAAVFAGLDRVLMVPCHLPPHKSSSGLTDGFHRFAMLALALQGERRLLASPIELLRGGTSYTSETLRQLADEAPGDELFLVVGSDSFVELDTWRAFEEILAGAGLLVVPRPGVEPDGIRPRSPETLRRILLPPGEPCPRGVRGRLPFAAVVDGDLVDVSSTDIRSRVRDGRSISGMVPAPVETYIRKQGLYGPAVHA